MKQYNTHQVVMLPTENTSQLYLSNDVIPSLLSNWRGKGQHLYFLSDEPIKKGDWFYVPNQMMGPEHISNEWFDGLNTIYAKKIIATTDSSLKRNCNCAILCTGVCDKPSLPQPSQEWIKYFIEQYNQGNIITEVEVEYQRCKTPLDCGKVYDEELTTQTIRCSKCGTINTFPFGGDYYCENQKLVINSDNIINIKFLVEEIDYLSSFIRQFEEEISDED